MLEDEPDAGAVVEQHLPHRRAGQRIADGDDRELLRDLLPTGSRRIERRDDEPVDELVGELARQHPLAARLAARVDDDHVQVVPAELAAEQLDEALLPEVLQRAREHADKVGAAAHQGASHRVARVTELFRRGPDALLRLRRGLDPPQRIGDGGRRQAGRGGDVLDRDATARRHRPTVASGAAGIRLKVDCGHAD